MSKVHTISYNLKTNKTKSKVTIVKVIKLQFKLINIYMQAL